MDIPITFNWYCIFSAFKVELEVSIKWLQLSSKCKTKEHAQLNRQYHYKLKNLDW